MNIKSKNKPAEKETRNPAEYAVLGALSKGAVHGYDLHQFLHTHLGAIWTLGISQVYALLIRLEEEGLVAHQRQNQDKRPDRKVFSLTPAGLKVLKEWLRRPVPHVRDLRLEFLTKLHFARIGSRNAEKVLITVQLAALEEKRKRIDIQRESTETAIESQALEFRLSQTQAAINWLKKLAGD